MIPFPVSDFNFAMAGLATLAATVGYRYAHKFATTSNGTSGDGSAVERTSREDEKHASTSMASPISEQATSINPEKQVIHGLLTRKGSHKRKEPHDGFDSEDTPDLGYPHNLVNIYPRKRCRTPASDVKSTEDASNATPIPVQEPPNDPPSPDDWVFVSLGTEPPRTPSPEEGISVAPALTARGTGSSAEETSLPLTGQNSDEVDLTKEDMAPNGNARAIGNASSEHLESNSVEPFSLKPEGNSPYKLSLLRPSPLKSSKLSLCKSGAFAAFAGTSSTFNDPSASEAPKPKTARPIWSTRNDLADNSQDTTLPLTDNVDAFSTPSEHAITQAIPIAQDTIPCPTGEENEDVQKELKNVKLYVKRGNKSFSGGMVGHIKLLQDRNTQDERLLFRREPLRKVSMNVRILPSVRCTYDKNDHALRVITQEVIPEGTDTEGKTPSLEIVVYALKPGRGCLKQDFEGFAESLVAHSKFSKPTASVPS